MSVKESTMEIGIYGVCTDETLRPDVMAKLIEDAGFDAFAVGEHTHIPAGRDSPYPDGDLPAGYTRTMDLFVALSWAAQATTRLKVTSSIMQLAQRDPIITAKEAASLDFLSGGRLDLPIGHGWNVEEMRNHGVDPETRYALVREKILAIREIFREDVATFHGEFVNFDRIWSWPKPAQEGGVPMILGGNSPGSEERALEYGDGWAPIHGDGVVERVAAFTSANPGVPVHVAGVPTDPAVLDAYGSAGAYRCVMNFGHVHPGDEGPVIEELRRAVDAAAG
jgi:probable F420-dependent oxidoreductase